MQKYKFVPGNPYSFMIRQLLIVTALMLLLIQVPVWAAPDEAQGRVASVLDGDTIEVLMHLEDGNVMQQIGLADVDAPSLTRAPGIPARDFTSALLVDREIWMDLDGDLPVDGIEGKIMAVVYLQGPYSGPVFPCYNRILVDSGHALVSNDTENEFDPEEWWEGSSPVGGDSLTQDMAQLEAWLREIWNRLLQA